MNERIKELAKQLGYNVDFTPSDDETDRAYQVVDNEFAEKFAELLVKECANYIDAFNSENMVEEGISGNMLKQHFGVEE
jgi:hypothetical protein